MDDNRKRNIVDCSDWSEEELKSMHKIGIRTYNPANGDVETLAQLASNAQEVNTIDTALAHICAVIGKESNLLLTKYPDERWYQHKVNTDI